MAESNGRSPSYHEVVKQVLAAGLGAVERMEPAPSRRSLSRACDELRRLRKGDVADEVERHFLNGRHHGNPPPKEGEQRPYRVQEQGGLCFVRIPTITMGLTKGQAVVATFQKNGKVLLTCGLEDT